MSDFPSDLWNYVQSVDNLTPRGLQSHFSSTDLLQLDSHSLKVNLTEPDEF